MSIDDRRFKITFVILLTALTTAIHYGFVLEPIFRDAHWIHAVHSRFCYIPIVMAAAWFGLRGGVWSATAITLTVIPFVMSSRANTHNFAGEIVEIVFYFALAVLVGALVDRDRISRRRQEEMRQRLDRSERLSLIGQVAAGVAHELKNPLASIKGAVEIIGDENTNARDRSEFRDILVKEIRRMDGTVTEFLEFARPKATRIEDVDLSVLLLGSVRQVENQASKEDIQIIEEVSPNIRIKGDREKLHQLALNVLLNAIQASKAGSSIVVSLAAENGTAEIEFTDQGEGIKQSDLDRIFEPFYTTRAAGSGLGLAIVKSIVDAHGGSIKIESVPSDHTTVTVSLPIQEKGI